MFGINYEVGTLLQDPDVSAALSSGDLRMGIVRRLTVYDRDYKLKRISKSKLERAVLAAYIFAKEAESIEFKEFRNSLFKFDRKIQLNANFSKVDTSLKSFGGVLHWDP